MALTPGTYAVISTTEGKITVRLFETDAPITVKNFIDLPEGSRPNGPIPPPAPNLPISFTTAPSSTA